MADGSRDDPIGLYTGACSHSFVAWLFLSASSWAGLAVCSPPAVVVAATADAIREIAKPKEYVVPDNVIILRNKVRVPRARSLLVHHRSRSRSLSRTRKIATIIISVRRTTQPLAR
jgi:hypothetical protein